MKLEKLLRRLALDAGERILLIDESRALHAARTKQIEAAAARAPTSVSVIPLTGVLYPRSMADFRTRLAAAVANPDVGHIVVPIDSPGGTYNGTPETAAAIAAAAQVKPVTAHIDSLGASAAYWNASQATTIAANPSADVGSIGVLAINLDLSKMLEDFGVKATVFRSVPFKAEGVGGLEPLTDSAAANLQGEVDDAHGEFVRAVAAGRRASQAKVNAEFGQGRTMNARKALDAGMIDKVASLEDVLAGARARVASRPRRSSLAFA